MKSGVLDFMSLLYAIRSAIAHGYAASVVVKGRSTLLQPRSSCCLLSLWFSARCILGAKAIGRDIKEKRIVIVQFLDNAKRV